MYLTTELCKTVNGTNCIHLANQNMLFIGCKFRLPVCHIMYTITGSSTDLTNGTMLIADFQVKLLYNEALYLHNVNISNVMKHFENNYSTKSLCTVICYLLQFYSNHILIYNRK